MKSLIHTSDVDEERICMVWSSVRSCDVVLGDRVIGKVWVR